MDQHKKQLSSMDPKLKEAYEKVMNTPVQSPTSGAMQPPQIPPVPPNPPIPSVQPDALQTQANTVMPGVAPTIQPQPTQPTTAPGIAPVMPPPAPSVTPNVSVNPSNVQQTVHIDYTLKKPPSANVSYGRKKLGIPPVVYIVGCVLFFILYTLFWLKVFGVPIPLLG